MWWLVLFGLFKVSLLWYLLGFFFFSINTLFIYLFFFKFSFFPTCDSHGTQHLTLGLVGMNSAAASIWVITSFPICHSEDVFQGSPEDYQSCFLQLSYIACLYLQL